MVRENITTLGSIQLLALKEARDKRTISKKLIKQGIHPKDHFDEIKNTNLKALDDTFTFIQTYEETIKELELRKLADTSIRRYKKGYMIYF